MNRHDEALLKKLKDTVAKQGKISIPKETIINLFEHKGPEIRSWIIEFYGLDFLPKDIIISEFINGNSENIQNDNYRTEILQLLNNKNVVDFKRRAFINGNAKTKKWLSKEFSSSLDINPKIIELLNEENDIDIKNIERTVKRYRQAEDFFERLEQEGITDPSSLREQKLAEFIEFRKNTDSNIGSHIRIPLIEHVTYLLKDESSKVPEDLIKIICDNSKKLLSSNSNWKLFFWTNYENNIPESLRALPNIEIKNINILSSHLLYSTILRLLDESKTVEHYKSIMSKLSDLIRHTVIKEFGGIYHDCDYVINKSEELLLYMKSFGLIAGWQFFRPESDLGAGFIAAMPDHPMTNLIIELIYRNLNSKNTPVYVQSPINNHDKIIFETGPSVVTAAYYKFLTTTEKDDSILLPPQILYHQEFARSYPGQKCSYTGSVNVCFDFDGQEVCSIGGDPSCCTWHERLSLDPFPDTLQIGVELNGTFIPYDANLDPWLYPA